MNGDTTIGPFNAAWDAYMTAIASPDVTAQIRAREALYTAAQSHASASRPLGNVTRYYISVSEDPDAGPGEALEAAQELDGVRRAAAILAGAWPGTLPTVSTGG